MPQTITIGGTTIEEWIRFETLNSVTQGADGFNIIISDTAGTTTNIFEQFNDVIVTINGTTVFNGRVDEIIPIEDQGLLEINGKNHIDDLMGEFIVESFGVIQAATNNPDPTELFIALPDTTHFEVNDEVLVEAVELTETAIINTVTATCIKVNSLSVTTTTPTTTVGTTGSFIVDDLVSKHGTNMTRTNIQISTGKFIVTFKGITAFEAIEQIADAEEFEFGEDLDRNFFYQPRNFANSGVTIELGVSDVITFVFPRQGHQVVNLVDVYGNTPTEGTQIAVRREDPASQIFYGSDENPQIRGITIIDEKIKTELQAEAIGDSTLSRRSFAPQLATITVLGLETVKAGELIGLKGFTGAPDGQYLIIEKRHVFPPGTTVIKVAQFEVNQEEIIVNIIKRLREREKESLDENVTTTKLKNFFETTQHSDVIVSIIQVNANNTFILSHAGRAPQDILNSKLGRGFNAQDGSSIIQLGRNHDEVTIL